VTAIPQIPESAPFSAEQRTWINGYLAGLFSNGSVPSAVSRPSVPSLGPILFLYGSQTGTAEGLARRFGKEAKKRGYETRVVGMDSFLAADLLKEKRVALITSTYGDGELPDNAHAFWDSLKNGAPQLHQLEYSVLALGDTNYVQFCEAGKLFDLRLEELGAKRISPRVDCDVDYEAPATTWLSGLFGGIEGHAAPAVPPTIAATAEDPVPALIDSSFGKSNPFPATLKTNLLLNAPGSTKETRHFEIALEGSGLEYEAGDALGVFPSNCPDLVDEILASAHLSGEEMVKAPEDTMMPLREALVAKYDLKPFLTALPPEGVSATDLVGPLRKLQPRLYSISSSPKAHPGEVHLTVSIVRYELNERRLKGVCSTYLAERVADADKVPVFIHKSPSFRLPADHSRPIIMVGPGTGIAPFRAFLEERRATGATGKNWLFFGDQRADTDFLYRGELTAMLTEGSLHRLDLAFSRDQAEKIYVQHRMEENAAELWAWLQEGAYFYVCGDAKRMAKDVDAALHRVIETAGGVDAQSATDFVKQLKTEKRYLRDVY
jgi:sulfite reductase (NADPH) flavoprotein alpha-component